MKEPKHDPYSGEIGCAGHSVNYTYAWMRVQIRGGARNWISWKYWAIRDWLKNPNKDL